MFLYLKKPCLVLITVVMLTVSYYIFALKKSLMLLILNHLIEDAHLFWYSWLGIQWLINEWYTFCVCLCLFSLNVLCLEFLELYSTYIKHFFLRNQGKVYLHCILKVDSKIETVICFALGNRQKSVMFCRLNYSLVRKVTALV